LFNVPFILVAKPSRCIWLRPGWRCNITASIATVAPSIRARTVWLPAAVVCCEGITTAGSCNAEHQSRLRAVRQFSSQRMISLRLGGGTSGGSGLPAPEKGTWGAVASIRQSGRGARHGCFWRARGGNGS
jgi:hypothetical protein